MISVRERSKEIGMLRAIGISKRTIIKYVLAESILVCMIGFIIGLSLGIVGADILDEFLKSTEEDIPVGVELTTVTPELVFQVSSITLLIGIMASLVPAAWASKLLPVESIRKI
jgi:putative ABC transport system permease protein